jgi:branched-subunit amino acid transport protein AzlD
VNVAVIVQLLPTVPLVVLPETVPPQPSTKLARVLPLVAVAVQE